MRPGRGVDHAPSSSTEIKESVEYPLWVFLACSRVNFTLLSEEGRRRSIGTIYVKRVLRNKC